VNTDLITLRGNIASEVRTLIQATTVTRQPRIGATAMDRSGSAKFASPRFTAPYQVHFPPVRLRVVENVTLVQEYIALHDAGVITDHLYGIREGAKPVLSGPANMRLDRFRTNERVDPRLVDTPTLVIHNEGGGTWGHWVVQGLPRVLWFRRVMPEGKIAVPRDYLMEANNFGRILRLYGVEHDDVVPLSRDVSWRLREAVFIDPLSQPMGVHPAALEVLREQCPRLAPPPNASDRTFITRATGGNDRGIDNAAEIDAIASDLGFRPTRLGSTHVEQQIATWQHGAAFMSVLGSDLTNLVFAKPGSDVLSITPDFHGDMFFFDLAAAVGLRWHELLCGHIVEKREPRRSSSFAVDPRVFRDFLTRALP
jgi:Glycosyltransferase 61